MQDSRVEREAHPGPLTEVRSDVATEIGRPNTTPPLVSVPNLTNLSQPSINHAQYSVQPDATQPQTEPTTPDPVSMRAQEMATLKPNSSFTLPANRVFPNLSAWNFPTTGHSVPLVAISLSAPPGFSRAPNTPSDNNATVLQIFPVTTGDILYCLNPFSGPNPVVEAMSFNVSSKAPMSVGGPEVVPTVSIATPRIESTVFTVQDLVPQLASSRKDHLPEWKLAQYKGHPSQWHEWFGQFKSAIDSAPPTDDVNLTYLKTLMTGEAKTAIAEFAYYGIVNKDALKTLKRRFGRPQAVVSAYFDEFGNFPPLKMHNSESVISSSATISVLKGVFRSLPYHQDLSGSSLSNQATQKLPPNLQEAWPMYTVKKNWDQPTLREFNDWLKDKAEAYERTKLSSAKPKTEDSNPPADITRTRNVHQLQSNTVNGKQSRQSTH